MILVIIRMKVTSEKRMELSQTIASLSGSIRMEKGCRRCDFCQSREDENRLLLLEEWNTEENLIGHLKSKSFKVFREAMNLLEEPYQMVFHTVFHPAGMEEIAKNRTTLYDSEVEDECQRIFNEKGSDTLSKSKTNVSCIL